MNIVDLLNFILLCDNKKDVLIRLRMICETSSNVIRKFMNARLWVSLASEVMEKEFYNKLSILEVADIIRNFNLSFNDTLVFSLDNRNFIYIRGTNLLSATIESKLNLRTIKIIDLSFAEPQLSHSMFPTYYLSRFIFHSYFHFRLLPL